MTRALLLSCLVCFASLSAPALSWAQNDPRKNARDTPDHDPSKKSLVCKYTYSQQTTAIRKVMAAIFTGKFFKKPVKPTPPESYDALNIHSGRYTPQTENGLTLINSKDEFKGVSTMEFGFCYGLATLDRNFKVLAVFKPSELPVDRFRRVLDPVTDRQQWLDYYLSKIEEIARGQTVVTFPGFANARELSLIPEFELHMKLMTRDIWSEEAIRLSSLKSMLRSSVKMSKEQVFKVVDRLENDVANHQMPKIFLHSFQKSHFGLTSRYQHVVLVYDVQRSATGITRIKVWDINFYAETLLREPKEIIIDPNGNMIYHPWYQRQDPNGVRLARIEVTPENDEEVMDHLEALESFRKTPEGQAYYQQAK